MKFLMDSDFAEMNGHAWRVEQGQVADNLPLLKQDRPWDSGVAGCTDIVMYDEEDKIWRLWYVAGKISDPHYDWVLAYAESNDGISWQKPELDICRWEDGSKTNILLTSDIGGGFLYPSVIKNKGVDGPKRWEMYLFIVPGPDDNGTIEGLPVPKGLDRHPRHWGLYRFFSADGLHWKINDGPILFWDSVEMPAYSLDPRYICDGAYIHKKDDGTYVMYCKMPLRNAVKTSRSVCGWGKTKRTWGRSISENGLHWSPPVLLLDTDDRDPQDLAVIELSVLLGKERHLGIWSRMHSNEARVDLGFAAGTDSNIRWFQPGRQACLHNPPLGEIGGGQMRVFHHPIEHDGKIYIYFGGFEGLHGNPEDPKYELWKWFYYGGLGCASWDADRLWAIGSFAGGDNIATLDTIFQKNIAEKNLYINARSFGEGTLKAELLDKSGKVMKGYSFADFTPLKGDKRNFLAKWKSSASSPKKGVFIRFALQRSWLYSFEWR